VRSRRLPERPRQAAPSRLAQLQVPYSDRPSARRTRHRLRVELLADHLGVRIVSADRLVAHERLEELERLQAYAFPAAAFEIKEKAYVVPNPLRAEGRQASDIVHELSHLTLEHELTEIREVNGLPFRTCPLQRAGGWWR
jgi:IrrE N-terminal-like domain